MLIDVLAHAGQPLAPHDLWTAWSTDPAIVIGLALATWLFARGRAITRRHGGRRNAACFWAGLSTLVVALLSPLDALAAELASAHMVQHVLVMLVAAPLLAVSAPLAVMLAALPRRARKATASLRRDIAEPGGRLAFGHPHVAWLLHAVTLWFWHASAPYGVALRHPAIHALEHVMFLLTALVFWWIVAGTRHRMRSVSDGHAALLVFTMGVQSVLLAALMTFARAPWYDEYAGTTTRWGLTPLADQQLAGVIMWVPAGFVFVGAGVVLITRWIRAVESDSIGTAAEEWGPVDSAMSTIRADQ